MVHGSPFLFRTGRIHTLAALREDVYEPLTFFFLRSLVRGRLNAPHHSAPGGGAGQSTANGAARRVGGG